MIWLGILIILVTFYAIIKKYETRLVLCTSGVVMATLSGKLGLATKAFSDTMVSSSLVIITCTVMGFAFVMKITECDQHMVRVATTGLSRVKPILIPMVIIVTFFVNTAMTSAAGTAAAVGVLLIPLLINSGVHPATAGAAVFAGTWGNVFSLGSAHPPFIANLANTDVITVLAKQAGAVGVALLVVIIAISVGAVLRKEHKGYIFDSDKGRSSSEQADFKVCYPRAVVPFVPLVLLILASKQVGILPPITAPEAMLLGVLLAFIVTRRNPQEIAREFFLGMGNAYANIVGLMISAAVFTKGLETIGITTALTDLMKESTSIAKLGATFGPMLIAILSGSGDAATLAFNGVVTPHAANMGFDISKMGSLAFITGALGRSMSPVAGVAIICAGLAGVSSMELVKRTAPGMLIAAIVCMLILL